MFTFHRKPRPSTAHSPAPKRALGMARAVSKADAEAEVSPGPRFDFARVPIMPPPILRDGVRPHTAEAPFSASRHSYFSAPGQAQLKVSQPGDALETEADHLADAAMGGGLASVATGAQPVSTAPAATARSPVARQMGLNAGQPLEPGIRAEMEARFGHGFGAVRVHTDGAAARSARTLDAAAYTVGSDIVFDQGEHRSGAHPLLVHELAHVVQQGGASPIGGTRRPAMAALTGTIARKRRTKAPPPPLMYDTSTFTNLKSPRVGTKLADVQATIATLQAKSPPALGPRVSVKGVTSGSNEEIFLYFLIAELGQEGRKRTEADVIAPIDWPSDGAAAPVGHVTVRIDAQGNASAELIGRGPVTAPSTYKDVRTAKKALIASYGFKSISEDGATWSLDDLNKVDAALKLLKPDDAKALRGLDLVRVATETDTAGKSISAAYKSEESIALNATTATVKAEIRLANSAFSGDTVSFLGGAAGVLPSSYQTIFHEVGHAVETQLLHEARGIQVMAMAGYNAAIGSFAAADANFMTAYNTLQAEWKAVAPKMLTPTDRAYDQALIKVIDKLVALGGNTDPDKSAQHKTAAETAITARDNARDKLGAGSMRLIRSRRRID